MFLFYVVALLATTVYSLEEYQFLGSCDEHSVPYKITVNEHSRPEIHCASPSCLGDEYIPSDRHHTHVHRRAHNVTCDGYRDNTCHEADQWVAGFMEVNNGGKLTFKAKCCSYTGLVNAKPVKTVVLQTDEEFTGGAYVRNEGVGGFDLIKEVKRRVQRGVVKFEVTIVRMPCQLDEAEDYDQDLRVPAGSRTGYRVDHKSYRGLAPRRPLYRSPFRPFGFRRRNLIDDYYYDYEEEYYQPRRRFELRGNVPRSRVRTAQNVLWPIAYNSPKHRAYGAENEETDPYEPPKEIQVEATGSSNHPNMVLVVQQPPEYPKSNVQMPAYPSQTSDTAYAKSEVGPATAETQMVSMETYMQGPVQQQTQQVMQPVQMQGYQQANVAVQQPLSIGVTYGPMVPPVPDIQVHGQQATGQTYAVAPTGEATYQQQGYQQQAYQQQGVQQTYQPATYQTATTCGGGCTSCCAGGGMNNLFSQMRCFSGEDDVQTTLGIKKMKDLRVGDMVMSYEESFVTFSPVVMFLHNLPEQDAEFLQISTVHNQTMELTDLHLIYVSDCQPGSESRLIHSKEVKIGDCLSVLNGRGGILYSPIKTIEKVKRKGIYAPLTFTGEIFVNDVLASCHSNLGVRLLQQSFFTTYRSVSNFLRQITSLDVFSYGKELPTGVSMVTSAMDLFLPHSYF